MRAALCPELFELPAAPGRSQSLRSLLAKQLARLWLVSGPTHCSVPVCSRDLCLDLGCLERGLRWVPGGLDGVMRHVMLGWLEQSTESLGPVSFRASREASESCAGVGAIGF